MVSQRINFHQIANARDLGGMTTTSGRVVRNGKLIRSSQLSNADGHDRERLSELVELVIDLRTDLGRKTEPDPVIPGVKCLSIPVIEDLVTGITLESGMDEAYTKMMFSPEAAREYMIGTYRSIALGKAAESGYRRFLETLCENREKAVLWHCTAGKDRAGFAAVLVEYILGVDMDSIREDYLYTNACLYGGRNPGAASIENILPTIRSMSKNSDAAEAFIGKIRENSALVGESMNYLMGAREEYLQALFDSIKGAWGSFDGYLSRALGVDDAMRDTLQRLYLE